MKKKAPTLYLYPGLTFGPLLIRIKDAEGNPVPLAGWAAFAQVRENLEGPLLLDLTPVIAANDNQGIITLPARPPLVTTPVPDGLFIWDLVLRNTQGQLIVPMSAGVVVSETAVTIVPSQNVG